MSHKYAAARQAFGEGALSWSNDKIVAQLVSAEYVCNPVAHRDAKSIKGAIGAPVELTGKSIKDGWAKAGSITFKAVSGPDAYAIVLHRAGEEKTLIAYLDQIDRFPMKLNGGDVIIATPETGFFRI